MNGANIRYGWKCSYNLVRTKKLAKTPQIDLFLHDAHSLQFILLRNLKIARDHALQIKSISNNNVACGIVSFSRSLNKGKCKIWARLKRIKIKIHFKLRMYAFHRESVIELCILNVNRDDGNICRRSIACLSCCVDFWFLFKPVFPLFDLLFIRRTTRSWCFCDRKMEY